MDNLLPLVLGPGGALVVLVFIGGVGFTFIKEQSKIWFGFFKEQLEAQQKRAEAQEKRLNELHEKTLETLSSVAIQLEGVKNNTNGCSTRRK